MELKFKKLAENAVLPTKAHPDDAGYDLTVTSIEKLAVVADNESYYKLGFGVAVQIPEGFFADVRARSSIYKYRAWLSNGVGTIDAGYRGEISAVLCVHDYETLCPYKIGERAAQLVIHKLPDFTPVWADELSESGRGTGGYGSTGKF